MMPKPKFMVDSAYIEQESHIEEREKHRTHDEGINLKPQDSGLEKREINRGDVAEIEVRRSTKNVKVDGINDLPDEVLLHIMKFLDTKDAVRTCVLSKRWKDISKRLTDLTFRCRLYSRYGHWVRIFEKFASWILFGRDDSSSLHSLIIKNAIDPKDVDSVIRYALSHNVQKLKINLVSITGSTFESLPTIFCSKSLTFLKLCVSGPLYVEITLPESLHLPALKTLHLKGINFPASDNDCVEPFSKCHLLATLVLKHCPLHDDARVLSIYNSSLSNLTVCFSYKVSDCKIALSTPNLRSCTFMDFASHQLSSTCNLSLLEEVHLFDLWQGTSSILITWLEVLANVKILTLNSVILRRVLPELSNPNQIRPKPPCFVRLKLVKVRRPFPADIPSEQVSSVVEYLFGNSPMEGFQFHIINGFCVI